MLESLKLCLPSHFKSAGKLLKLFRPSCRYTSKRSSDSKLSSLASMEVSFQLKQVFNLMDTNGDGKLSHLEVRQVLQRLGNVKENVAEEAEGIVREMDVDGDGFIGLEEFMRVVGNDQNEGVSGETEILEAFGVFDVDKNGLISAEELQSVLWRIGCGRCTLKECRKMIKGVDRDGDGFVSFQEFKCMMIGES